MRLNAIINGVQVTVVDVNRSGGTTYVTYINSTGVGPGALATTQFTSSAYGDPVHILSTSAIWLA